MRDRKVGSDWTEHTHSSNPLDRHAYGRACADFRSCSVMDTTRISFFETQGCFLDKRCKVDKKQGQVHCSKRGWSR